MLKKGFVQVPKISIVISSTCCNKPLWVSLCTKPTFLPQWAHMTQTCSDCGRCHLTHNCHKQQVSGHGKKGREAERETGSDRWKLRQRSLTDWLKQQPAGGLPTTGSYTPMQATRKTKGRYTLTPILALFSLEVARFLKIGIVNRDSWYQKLEMEPALVLGNDSIPKKRELWI